MGLSVSLMAAMLAAVDGVPKHVLSGADKTKLPHWLRGSNGGGKTKNGRYYKKRIERRRRNAGR